MDKDTVHTASLQVATPSNSLSIMKRCPIIFIINVESQNGK